MKNACSFLGLFTALLFLPLAAESQDDWAAVTYQPGQAGALTILTPWAAGLPGRNKPTVLALLYHETRLDGADLATALGAPVEVIPWNLYRELWQSGADALLARLKANPPDVLLVMGLPPSQLPVEVAQKVEAGMGLVWLVPDHWNSPKDDDAPARRLLPFQRASGGGVAVHRDYKIKRAHPLTEGVPFDHLRMIGGIPFGNPDGEEVYMTAGARPVLAIRHAGQGRVVAWYAGTSLALVPPDFYSENYHSAPLVSQFLTPSNADENYSWLATALCWAARKTEATFPLTVEWREDASLRIVRAPSAPPVPAVAAVRVRVRDSWRQIIHEQTTPLPEPETETILRLPVNEHGHLLLDVWALDGAGQTMAWRTLAAEIPTALTAVLEAPVMIERAAGEIRCSVHLENTAGRSRALRIDGQVADIWGRELGKISRRVRLPPLAARTITVDLPVALRPIETRLANLRVMLFEDRTKLTELRAQPGVHQPASANEVIFGTTDSSHKINAHRGAWHAAVLRQYGLTCLTTWDGCENELRLNTERGTQPLYNQIEGGLGPVLNWSQQGNVMAWSFFDETRVNGSLKALEPMIRTAAAYSPFNWMIIDEPYIAPHTVEVDFSEPAVQAFRAQLQQEFGSDITRLNRHWGSAYGSFQDISPLVLTDCIRENRLALWVSFRRFVDRGFADYFGRIADTVKQYAPDAAVGVNIDSSGPMSGVDHCRFAQRLGFLSGYVDRDTRDDLYIMRSFLPRFQTWIGYMDPKEPLAHGSYVWETWYSLLGGSRSLMYFFNVSHAQPMDVYALFTPELRPRPKGATILPEIKLARDSVAGLLPTLQPAPATVAVLYSRSSGLLRWALDEKLGCRQKLYEPAYWVNDLITEPRVRRSHSEHTFVELLNALGLRVEYVADDELSTARLAGYKVLLLPSTVALSSAHLAVIRDFAGNGGGVVADWLCGNANETGAQDDSVAAGFDELFGISRPPLSALAMPDKELVKLPDTPGLELLMLGKEKLVLNGGTARGAYADGTPLLIANTVGSGRAVYLNGVPRVNAGSLAVFKGVLETAGVALPQVQLENLEQELDRFSGWTYNRFTLGSATVVSALRDYRAAGAGHVSFAFGRPLWIYDLLAAKLLGNQSQVSMEVPKSRPCVLSALPYRVDGVSVNLVTDIQPGQSVNCRLRVLTERGARPGKHVFLVQVTLADGTQPGWGRYIVEGEKGSGVLRLPVALNAVAGRWTISVTDLLTGQRGKAETAISAR